MIFFSFRIFHSVLTFCQKKGNGAFHQCVCFSYPFLFSCSVLSITPSIADGIKGDVLSDVIFENNWRVEENNTYFNKSFKLILKPLLLLSAI
jgi:hypothetical protein